MTLGSCLAFLTLLVLFYKIRSGIIPNPAHRFVVEIKQCLDIVKRSNINCSIVSHFHINRHLYHSRTIYQLNTFHCVRLSFSSNIFIKRKATHVCFLYFSFASFSSCVNLFSVHAAIFCSLMFSLQSSNFRE